LEIHDPQVSEKRKRFKRTWDSYALATGLNTKEEAVQVPMLLTVFVEEAREVFFMFSDSAATGDDTNIAPVLTIFEEYCPPRKNFPFERYRFHCHL